MRSKNYSQAQPNYPRDRLTIPRTVRRQPPPNNSRELIKNHKSNENCLTCGKYAKGMLCGYKLCIVLGAGATVMPLA